MDESLKEGTKYNYELSDKITQALEDADILFGDVVNNGETINLVGIDEDEWDEAADLIRSEFGLEVQVPDEDHEEGDDELIVHVNLLEDKKEDTDDDTSKTEGEPQPDPDTKEDSKDDSTEEDNSEIEKAYDIDLDALESYANIEVGENITMTDDLKNVLEKSLEMAKQFSAPVDTPDEVKDELEKDIEDDIKDETDDVVKVEDEITDESKKVNEDDTTTFEVDDEQPKKVPEVKDGVESIEKFGVKIEVPTKDTFLKALMKEVDRLDDEVISELYDELKSNKDTDDILEDNAVLTDIIYDYCNKYEGYSKEWDAVWATLEQYVKDSLSDIVKHIEDTCDFEDNLDESCSDKELVDTLVANGTCATKKEAETRVKRMSKEMKDDFCKTNKEKAKDNLLNDSLNEDTNNRYKDIFNELSKLKDATSNSDTIDATEKDLIKYLKLIKNVDESSLTDVERNNFIYYCGEIGENLVWIKNNFKEVPARELSVEYTRQEERFKKSKNSKKESLDEDKNENKKIDRKVNQRLRYLNHLKQNDTAKEDTVIKIKNPNKMKEIDYDNGEDGPVISGKDIASNVGKLMSKKAKDLDDSVITNFKVYKPSKEAEEVYNTIVNLNKLEEFEIMLEDIYPEGLTKKQVDDILTNDTDWVYDSLNIVETEGLEREESYIDIDEGINENVSKEELDDRLDYLQSIYNTTPDELTDDDIYLLQISGRIDKDGKAKAPKDKVVMEPNDKEQMKSELNSAMKKFFVDKYGDDFFDESDYGLQVEDDDDGIVVYAYAEVGYNTLDKLAQELDKVISKYDDKAYFDHEDSGRLVAYLY